MKRVMAFVLFLLYHMSNCVNEVVRSAAGTSAPKNGGLQKSILIGTLQEVKVRIGGSVERTPKLSKFLEVEFHEAESGVWDRT